MCGRYSVLTEEEMFEIRMILKDLSLQIVKDDFLDYTGPAGEVRPTNHAPVLLLDGPGLSFESIKWGFKKWEGSGVIINARSESLKIRSMFSNLINGRRCVVPAGEFFEWQKLGRDRVKHFIRSKSGSVLYMAALYRETEEGREFVIITKAATEAIIPIHNRMPAILTADQIEAWLVGTLSPEDLQELDYELVAAPCNEEEPSGQQSLFIG